MEQVGEDRQQILRLLFSVSQMEKEPRVLLVLEDDGVQLVKSPVGVGQDDDSHGIPSFRSVRRIRRLSSA